MAELMIVDDNSDLRELVEEIARDLVANIEVVHAPNGKAALTMLRPKKDSLNLIITDINMPFMCGVEFVFKIRTEFKVDTPVLLISGKPLSQKAEFLSKQKNTIFLAKPWNKLELESILKLFLEEKK